MHTKFPKQFATLLPEFCTNITSTLAQNQPFYQVLASKKTSQGWGIKPDVADCSADEGYVPKEVLNAISV